MVALGGRWCEVSGIEQVWNGKFKAARTSDEAGSTGMLWLDLMLANRSWVSVGNIYSECDDKTFLMGLKMKYV